jgi:Zn-dependent protease with chaperone function
VLLAEVVLLVQWCQSEPLAFTVGRSRRHTTMIVTPGLLRLDPPELEAALPTSWPTSTTATWPS